MKLNTHLEFGLNDNLKAMKISLFNVLLTINGDFYMLKGVKPLAFHGSAEKRLYHISLCNI